MKFRNPLNVITAAQLIQAQKLRAVGLSIVKAATEVGANYHSLYHALIHYAGASRRQIRRELR